jgi:hypothetical protein
MPKKAPPRPKWLKDVEDHDFDAAVSYLGLIYTGKRSASLVAALRAAKPSRFKAKDVALRSFHCSVSATPTSTRTARRSRRASHCRRPSRTRQKKRKVVADGYTLCAVYRRQMPDPMQNCVGAGPFLAMALISLASFAQTRPIEIHDRIAGNERPNNRIALTLDACSGQFDEDLILFLIRNRIPATLFVTKKWLDRNAHGLAILKANLDLFDIEDHGESHIPAVLGAGRKVYGIPGEPDSLHLRQEVLGGARAIEEAQRAAALVSRRNRGV